MGNSLRDTKPYLASASILCQPCAVAEAAVDTNEAAGEFDGRITWGPNMIGGTVNETFITGYKVAVVDGCGLPLEVPGGPSFVYLPKQDLNASCCAEEAYAITWSLTLPERSSHFMVVPYSDEWGEQDGGPLIRIVDNTGQVSNSTPPPVLPGITNGAHRRAGLTAIVARAGTILYLAWLRTFAEKGA